jgi:glyoxylase-like metal-dependent hydrolase (beta-lactamase superfamily II)
MNPSESQLEYAFGDTLPTPGTVHEVAPGLFWLRMALPFALDHINLWLARDDEGWTVIDCGIADDTTRASWESIFSTALRGLPITRVIATHFHPDHVGLADWLCTRWNAPLWMTAGEYLFARSIAAALPGTDDAAMLTHYQQHGLTDAVILEELRQRGNHYSTLVPAVPASYRRMHDAQTVRIGRNTWRVITGHGHSQEHAALYCAELDVLISGDMVLPRISTNVSVLAIEPESNPVQQYVDSLERFRHLPADTLVLPSHGKPFRGLHTRIEQLTTHHRDRLAEVVDACATPQSAADILPVMFRRPLDAHQTTFALGEALAHLHKLWFDGTLVRSMDADGILRFGIPRSA